MLPHHRVPCERQLRVKPAAKLTDEPESGEGGVSDEVRANGQREWSTAREDGMVRRPAEHSGCRGLNLDS